MRHIKESFEGINSINSYIRSKAKEERVDEGVKDWFNTIKDKFKNVYNYLKGIVVKVGSYVLEVSKTGLIIPAITPATAAAAYVNGDINKKSTFVHISGAAAKIVGGKNNMEDAVKLYGSGNSIDYWKRMIKEHVDSESQRMIIEQYMEDYLHRNPELVNEVKLQNDDPEAAYNVYDTEEKLAARIKMSLLNPKLARLLIWGAPGIGKTAILLSIIKSLKESSKTKDQFKDYRLIVKTLSNETPDNFTLPDYVEDIQDEDFGQLAKELNKEESVIRKLYKMVGGRKSIDVPKTWLPVYKPTGDKEVDAYLDSKCGSGLLFIDELSRATSQVLNVMLPLINEGNFNGYTLGSGWTIICASNRMNDDLESQQQIGNALANRFSQIHYEPTVHSWKKWAETQNYMSPLLLQWLSMPESENMSGAKFFYMDPNEDPNRIGETTLMCTPRAWTNAMKVLACYSHTGTLEGFSIFDIPRDIIMSALNEAIPRQAVDSFMAFLSVIEKIGNFDHAVYEVWQNGGKKLKIKPTDLELISLPLAQLVICAHADKLPTKEEFTNLAKWVVSTDSDQLASYVLNIFSTVFMVGVHDKVKRQLWYVQERIRRDGGDAKSPNLAALKLGLEEFLAHWKINFEDVPDWMEGIKLIITKYGKTFQNASIGDWEDALG